MDRQRSLYRVDTAIHFLITLESLLQLDVGLDSRQALLIILTSDYSFGAAIERVDLCVCMDQEI